MKQQRNRAVRWSAWLGIIGLSAGVTNQLLNRMGDGLAWVAHVAPVASNLRILEIAKTLNCRPKRLAIEVAMHARCLGVIVVNFRKVVIPNLLRVSLWDAANLGTPLAEKNDELPAAVVSSDAGLMAVIEPLLNGSANDASAEANGKDVLDFHDWVNALLAAMCGVMWAMVMMPNGSSSATEPTAKSERKEDSR